MRREGKGGREGTRQGRRENAKAEGRRLKVAGDRAAIERIIAPDWKTTGPDGGTRDGAAVLAEVFDTREHTAPGS
jgi:hypothetical protein